MRYTLKQVLKDGTVWTSPETFEAPTPRHVAQAVIAGYLSGEPRWAESPEGVLLYGMDAKGKGMTQKPLIFVDEVADLPPALKGR